MPTHSLSVVLLRLEKEISEIAISVEALHGLIVEKAEFNDEDMKRAQTIDIVNQKLVEIARFVQSIADITPEDVYIQIDIASNVVRLTDLATKLGGRVAAPATSGEPDFF